MTSFRRRFALPDPEKVRAFVFADARFVTASACLLLDTLFVDTLGSGYAFSTREATNETYPENPPVKVNAPEGQQHG